MNVHSFAKPLCYRKKTYSVPLLQQDVLQQSGSRLDVKWLLCKLPAHKEMNFGFGTHSASPGMRFDRPAKMYAQWCLLIVITAQSTFGSW